MYDQKFIWLGFFVAAGMFTSNSVIAQTNQSDTSGGQTFSSPTVSIDPQNGDGIPVTTQFNFITGEIVGGGIRTPVVATDSALLGCINDSCQKGSDSQPREVTLNDIAEALEAGLDQSLDNLEAAENNAKLADSGPRRIARRSAVSNDEARVCINPVYEARDIVERQLVESEKFIEQVNQIEPQKNIW